jgi:hypothetical protein
MVGIGRELISIKNDLVDHGQFCSLVETEIGISIRTAQGYMAIARLAGKSEMISLLSASTARILAAKSAPPNIVEHVITEAANGRILGEPAVKKLLCEDKETKRAKQWEAEAPARRAKAQRVREKAAAERAIWQVEHEQKRKKDQTLARSVINKFSSVDALFLAVTLTYDVLDEFIKLVKEGGTE